MSDKKDLALLRKLLSQLGIACETLFGGDKLPQLNFYEVKVMQCGARVGAYAFAENTTDAIRECAQTIQIEGYEMSVRVLAKDIRHIQPECLAVFKYDLDRSYTPRPSMKL